jgi:type I restriction enzyme S subunit
MDLIPTTGAYASRWEQRSLDQVTSGTYVEDGDVMVSKITPCFENGKQGILRIGAPFAYATTEVIPLRGKTSKTDTLFLHFLLLHPGLRAKLASQMEGSTNRQRLPKEVVEKAVVPVPPLNEQRQIAAVLSAVERAIERQELLIDLTGELKKALMQKLFSAGTRGEPLKRTEIGLVPQSWSVDHLDRAGDVIYGIQAAVANNIKPIGTRILTNKNIDLDGNIVVDKQSYFELRTERHRRTLLEKGDILFNWRSGSKEHVGKTAYFDLEGEWTHSSFILRIRPREEVSGRFLFHYLTWLRESKYFVKLHNYAVNAKFNKSAINALPIVLPDRAEQALIAGTLDVAIRKFNVHVAQRAALARLFRGLLHQLMTAKIRVHDLDLSALDEANQGPMGAV